MRGIVAGKISEGDMWKVCMALIAVLFAALTSYGALATTLRVRRVMPVMAMHAGKARRFLMQRPPIDVVLYAKRSGRKLPCVKRPSHSAADTFAVGMITPSRAIPVFTVAEPALAHRSPSTRPTAGRDRTRADSLGDREPALLLFHLDLLRDPDGVLCVGLVPTSFHSALTI